ncbi:MAG TPA: zf-HC2 domain-containing protein [Fimbriimonadales bacterium]|nr:zf-HC2 domain-containing protein [Fimbriimonadales bacterium]
MNCGIVQRRIASYIDGELSNDEAKKIREHLNSCDSCRAEFDSHKRIKELVSSLPQREPSQEFEQRLLARLATVGAMNAGVQIPFGLGLAIVSALGTAVAITIAIFLQTQTRPNDNLDIYGSSPEWVHDESNQQYRNPFNPGIPISIERKSP